MPCWGITRLKLRVLREKLVCQCATNRSQAAYTALIQTCFIPIATYGNLCHLTQTKHAAYA